MERGQTAPLTSLTNKPNENLMPKITVIEYSGAAHEMDAPAGVTLMEIATRNGIEAIEAECGGACACATCHVYVDEKWLSAVESVSGAAGETESALIEWTDEPRSNSRLACQIKLTEELDGLTVRLPATQG